MNVRKIMNLSNNTQWCHIINSFSKLCLLFQSNHAWLKCFVNSISFLFQLFVDSSEYELRSNPYDVFSISLFAHLHVPYLFIYFMLLFSDDVPSVDVKYVFLQLFKLDLLVSSLNYDSSGFKYSTFGKFTFLRSVEICLTFNIRSDDVILFSLNNSIFSLSRFVNIRVKVCIEFITFFLFRDFKFDSNSCRSTF